MIAGFASAGVIVAEFGYVAAISLDAASFAVSASVLLSLPLRTRRDSKAPDDGGDAGSGSKEEPRRLGAMILLRAAPVLAVMIVVRAADGLGSSSHNVALPVYSSSLDPSHPATFVSQFWATWAIGNIVMQQAIGRWAGRGGRQGPGSGRSPSGPA
ncbi:Multidrug efflux pump Tap OS=Streptomyces alboniger OX=132473 GN=CP975_10210 PE=3 SV=1 [Streptomyces alboniger]